MEILALSLALALAVWGAGTAGAAVWRGDIEVLRLIGDGTIDYTRRSQPIRYGCAILIRVHLAVVGAVGAIAISPQVPTQQWLVAGGAVAAVASLVACFRLGRTSVAAVVRAFTDESTQAGVPELVASLPGGSMKQLATAALRVRPELPAADTGYRDARTPSSGAIRAALDPVIRVERWKCDATGALALGAVTLAAIGGYTAPTGAREPWAMLAASATGLIAAVALWRWWTLRRAIGVGADTIASAAASWEPEAQFEARSARKSASHAASGRPDP